MTLIALIVFGVIISAVLGTVWYMPSTPTGRLHMRYLGFDKLSKEEQDKIMMDMKPKMWRYYGAQMVLSLLTSASVVFIVYMSIQNGVPVSMALLFPFANWLCFMVPVLGSQIIWGNCDRTIAWQKFFSDIAFYFCTVMIVAVVTALFSN